MARRNKGSLPKGGGANSFSELKVAIDSASVAQVDAITTLSVQIEEDLVSRIDSLIELFKPVSSVFKERSEEGAAPPVIPPSPGAVPPPPGPTGGDALPRETPGPIEGAMGAVGGILGGVGGVAAGAGAGALGAGLRVLSVGLGAMGNPAVAAGATVLVGFLAGLAGVAWLSGKALEALGEGFTDLSVGLDDLAQADYPDKEKLIGLTTAMRELLGAFDTGDALKMAIADGTMFSDLAKGLSDLSNTELDPSAIDTAGSALKSFMDQIGFGDAIVTRILTGGAFEGIANGLQALNDIQVDDANLKNAGESLKTFLSSVASLSSLAGGEIIDAFGADTLPAIATGLTALNNADVDPNKIANAGLGLKAFMDAVDFSVLVGGLMSKAISEENLVAIANGVKKLDETGAVIDPANSVKIAQSLSAVTGAAMNVIGLAGLATIDDNLVPFAEGIERIDQAGSTIDQANIDNLTQAASKVISTGNNLLGITGLAQIDDNLVPFANGMSALQETAANINPDDFDNIKLAMRKLISGMTGQEEGEGLGTQFIKGVTGAISSFAFPDLSNLEGIGQIFSDLGDVATLDSETINANLVAMKNAVKLMDDDNLGEFDRFGDFVAMTTKLEALDPARLNGIVNTVRELGAEIATGFKPTAARLEEQRQQVPDAAMGGNATANINAPKVTNTVNTVNKMSNISYAAPIPPNALVFT